MSEGPLIRVEQKIDGPAGAIETLTLAPRDGASRGDLLFLHGAWSSYWFWEPNFMPWFAARGYRCRALALRGHGGSDGALRWASVADYVQDVARVAQDLEDPILIGHSMGGFVAQKYAQSYRPRGMILLASVPPGGAWYAFQVIARHRPRALLAALARLDLYPVVADVRKARRLLFSPDFNPAGLEDQLRQYLGSESFRAFLDMLFAPIRAAPENCPPVAVVGAAHDAIISPKDLRKTAALYGTDPIVLEGAAHMMMLEPGWEEVAQKLEDWSRENVPGAEHSEDVAQRA